MNLFILSLDPAKAAEQMMDKHVNKILLEAVQMLCTAKRILDPDAPEEVSSALYKLAHKTQHDSSNTKLGTGISTTAHIPAETNKKHTDRQNRT